jgi:hypothetical protein
MSLARAVQRRKLEVCSEPLFPGGPDKYRFYPERCILKEKPIARKSSTSKSTTNANTNTLKQSLKAELSTIKAILVIMPSRDMQNAPDVAIANKMLKAMKTMHDRSIVIFRGMVNSKIRAKYPDPVTRFEHLAKDDKQVMLSILKKTVFTMLEIHLEGTLAEL